jgi:hypothetical protein
METITISKTTARRFVLGRQGLWPGRRWSGQNGTAEALRAIEEVQMDPLNVAARSHDIVLLHGFWLEEHAPLESPLFAAALARGLVRFGEFLDARRVNIDVLEPVTLRAQVREQISRLL